MNRKITRHFNGYIPYFILNMGWGENGAFIGVNFKKRIFTQFLLPFYPYFDNIENCCHFFINSGTYLIFSKTFSLSECLYESLFTFFENNFGKCNKKTPNYVLLIICS